MMNRPLLAILLTLPLCCCAQDVADLAGKTVVSLAAAGMGDSSVKTLIAVAVLVAGVVSLIWWLIGNRKQKALGKELAERSQTIETQKRQEAELRKELEKKQKELDDALQTAQAADNEKTAVLEDLEDASELARLASFHYDFNTHIRTGSKLVCELWPVDETGRGGV